MLNLSGTYVNDDILQLIARQKDLSEGLTDLDLHGCHAISDIGLK